MGSPSRLDPKGHILGAMWVQGHQLHRVTSVQCGSRGTQLHGALAGSSIQQHGATCCTTEPRLARDLCCCTLLAPPGHTCPQLHTAEHSSVQAHIPGPTLPHTPDIANWPELHTARQWHRAASRHIPDSVLLPANMELWPGYNVRGMQQCRDEGQCTSGSPPDYQQTRCNSSAGQISP